MNIIRNLCGHPIPILLLDPPGRASVSLGRYSSHQDDGVCPRPRSLYTPKPLVSGRPSPLILNRAQVRFISGKKIDLTPLQRWAFILVTHIRIRVAAFHWHSTCRRYTAQTWTIRIFSFFLARTSECYKAVFNIEKL